MHIAYCVYRERPGCCWVLAAVERLANEYLREGHIYRPPVPSNAVTIFDQRRSIEVRLVPLKLCHGGVWLSEQDWVIQLNAKESPLSRRHTLFHEAFHIACRNVSPAFKKSSLEDRPFREFLADYFAACFLMPKDWISEQWAMAKDVPKIARIFEVPVSLMSSRLNQLGLLVS